MIGGRSGRIAIRPFAPTDYQPMTISFLIVFLSQKAHLDTVLRP